MPACILLYLVAFLDRTAIGFTRIAGINEDLHLSQKQYQICLTIFFISYAMVEVPCVLIQSYIGAKVWLPLITVIWVRPSVRQSEWSSAQSDLFPPLLCEHRAWLRLLLALRVGSLAFWPVVCFSDSQKLGESPSAPSPDT